MATRREPTTMDVSKRHLEPLVRDPLFVQHWQRIIAAFGISEQSVCALAEERRKRGGVG